MRPAIDPLFRSIAEEYGARGMAVVLSGSLSDGASGAATVAAAGGTVLVQDPADAVVPSMPESALAATPTAITLTAPETAEELARRAAALPPAEPEREVLVTAERRAPENGGRPPGPPTALTFPECHGPLWESQDGQLVRGVLAINDDAGEDIAAEAS